MELAGLMTRAAADLGTENLLVVPGAVHIPWRTDYEPVAKLAQRIRHVERRSGAS